MTDNSLLGFTGLGGGIDPKKLQAGMALWWRRDGREFSVIVFKDARNDGKRLHPTNPKDVGDDIVDGRWKYHHDFDHCVRILQKPARRSS